MKKKNLLLSALTAVFVLFMSASIILTYNSTRELLQNSYENDHRVISGMISNAIDNAFLRAITVSETMAKDVTTVNFLNTASREETVANEEKAADYLTSIRDGFGYSMVFGVSDLSKVYYTYDGISRYIDPSDPSESWYTSFMESGSPYKLDVDTDKTNNWALSVFINAGVHDNEGELIGLCGIGVDMTELQNKLEKYERIYDVKIDMIDYDGLIQIDTDTTRIENDYIEISDLSNYTDGECYYEIRNDGNRTITYMDKLDWFLVVQNNRKESHNINTVILPSVICLILGIVIMLILIFVFVREKKKVYITPDEDILVNDAQEEGDAY